MPSPKKQLLFSCPHDVAWYKITSWPCPLPPAAKINPVQARSRKTFLTFSFVWEFFTPALGISWTGCSFPPANSSAAPLAVLMQLFAAITKSLKERRMKSHIWMESTDASLSTATWFHSTSVTWIARVRRKVVKCLGYQKHERSMINNKSYPSSQFPYVKLSLLHNSVHLGED